MEGTDLRERDRFIVRESASWYYCYYLSYNLCKLWFKFKINIALIKEKAPGLGNQGFLSVVGSEDWGWRKGLGREIGA